MTNLSDVHASLLEDLNRMNATREEVMTVLDALREGNVDGSSCGGCLIANIAHSRNETYSNYTTAPKFSLFERWLMGSLIDFPVHTGVYAYETPSDNSDAKILEQWLVEWIEDQEDQE